MESLAADTKNGWHKRRKEKQAGYFLVITAGHSLPQLVCYIS